MVSGYPQLSAERARRMPMWLMLAGFIRRTLPAVRVGLGLILGLGGLGVLGVLSSCGNGESERAIYVYNWADYIGAHTLADFEQATGIAVSLDTYDSDETMEAKMLAGDSGYDVVNTAMEFFGREIRAGAFEPLHREWLEGYENIDPEVLKIMAKADPGNRYVVPYLHSVNGFAYNRAMIKARLPNAPVDSLALIFDPKIVAHFADCGVVLLDSPQDTIGLALAYLHKNPNTRSAEDYQAAEQVIAKVMPFIRNFDSSEYVSTLANGEVCIAMGWSSDYAVAMHRAKLAGLNVDLEFSVPKEGASATYNGWVIPKGALHPQDGHRFISFTLRPKVIAAITNEIYYGNDNRAADRFVKPEILHDPRLYPDAKMRARLFPMEEADAATERLRTQIWTRLKAKH
jgi:putrescine transport system substrate-binding protein